MSLFAHIIAGFRRRCSSNALVSCQHFFKVLEKGTASCRLYSVEQGARSRMRRQRTCQQTQRRR